MSRGKPDDPTNPLRKRPPPLERDPEINQLYRLNQRAEEAGTERIRMKGNPMREFMFYAFIAETGLRASDVVLVTKRTPHPDGKGERVEQYFRRRTAQDPVS